MPKEWRMLQRSKRDGGQKRKENKKTNKREEGRKRPKEESKPIK